MSAPGPEPTAYQILNVRDDAHGDVIQAAYRALARLSHPDLHREPGADQRMAGLNRAYAMIGSAERRSAYDAELARRARPPRPTTAAEAADRAPMRPPADVSGSASLDFGRYAGWSIAQLARHDPDYLRWLSRHSSGIRFRREIEQELRSISARSPVGGRMSRFSPFRAQRSGAAAG